MSYYPYCYGGAVDVFNDEDVANIPNLLLRSDPYRQRELSGMQEYLGWGSPYSVWNPRTDQQFAMAPAAAWNEDAVPLQLWGRGYNSPANHFGGSYWLSNGEGTSWQVPDYLAGQSRFNDDYTDPW